jgi:tRNA threonylcarbamoyladenosine biosynthesis protein TsaB
MTILALEFSSEQRSVALARDGVVLAEAAQQTESRATDALGLIEKVLAQAKVPREDVEVIAVGLGPGSYTGVRAAIAVAQGWQLAFAEPEQNICGQTAAMAQRRLARGIKLLGVSSVAAIAAAAQAAKIFGRVNVVVDAQRGEFYAAGWEISDDRREEISPLKIISAAGLAARGAGEICVGPAADRIIFPSAAMLARLAAGRTDFTRGEDLEPVYLRETAFVKAAPGRVV